MRLTKFEHACVTLEKDGGVVVIDPGMLGAAADVLRRADAVMITHEHADHFDEVALRTSLAQKPDLTLWANAAVASRFHDFARQVREVRHGQALDIAGFTVHVYGDKHAPVHKDIPLVANTGFLIEGQVFHPGDSFTVPEDPVPTLLLPISGPWLKAGDVIDFFRAVGPARSYAIHDGTLNEAGLNLMDTIMTVAARPSGAVASRLGAGESAVLAGI